MSLVAYCNRKGTLSPALLISWLCTESVAIWTFWNKIADFYWLYIFCVASCPVLSISRFGDFVVVLLETQTNVFVRTGYNRFGQRSLITWIIIDQLSVDTFVH